MGGYGGRWPVPKLDLKAVIEQLTSQGFGDIFMQGQKRARKILQLRRFSVQLGETSGKQVSMKVPEHMGTRCMVANPADLCVRIPPAISRRGRPGFHKLVPARQLLIDAFQGRGYLRPYTPVC